MKRHDLRDTEAIGMMFRAVLLVSLVLGWQASSALGATRYVPQQYPTIQAAVDAAAAGDIVQVAAGTYSDVTHPCGHNDPTLSIVVMKSGITLRGASWEGTILDARGLGRVITCYGTSDVVIEKLTVTGAAPGGPPFAKGSILCKDAGTSVTIRNCNITENQSNGVFCAWAPIVNIEHCRLWRNEGTEAMGGGVFLIGSGVQISDCHFLGNESVADGGAIATMGACSPVITDCLIEANYAAQGRDGGGLFLTSSSATVVNTTIQYHSAPADGGGIYAGDCALTLRNCRLYGNSCGNDDRGGGMALYFCPNVLIEDCTFAENGATGTSKGGAVYAYASAGMMIRQTTFAKNYGPVATVYVDEGSGVTLEKSIIAHTLYGGQAVFSNGDLSASCCDSYGNEGGDALPAGSNNFSVDPLFCNTGWMDFDYRLQVGSPCLPGSPYTQACGNVRIGGEDDCGPTDVPFSAMDLPLRPTLLGAPNPCGGEATFVYELPEAAEARLLIVDAAGRCIRTIQDGNLSAGRHAARWDGKDTEGRPVPGGVYFSKLIASGQQVTRGIVVVH